MSDPNVREIQLGGKQLVFLFMASVVVAVAIFLLGISVGRGVGPATAETADVEAPADDLIPPGEMPPATELTDKDRAYHDKLQGQTTPPPQPLPADEPPSPAATPAPAETTSVAVAKPQPGQQAPPLPPPAPPGARASGAAPTAAAEPAPKPTVKPAPKPAAPPPASGWWVQVAAFKSRDNADRQVAALKAKGYSAVVQSDPGELFRVRIGPFKDRAEATRTSERLQKQEGIVRPSIGR
jgi:cell division septation protein DedD